MTSAPGSSPLETEPACGLSRRVRELAWPELVEQLDARGFAATGPLLSLEECRSLTEIYTDEPRFRSRITMERHGFGRGEYSYFSYPLPELVEELRQNIYPFLAPVANAWAQRSRREAPDFPPTFSELQAACHASGQLQPTPLLLRYGKDDYNCLHQDVYGAFVFPLQVAVLLSEPGEDFSGGEFVMTEQRPRRQSRVEVVPLRRGEAVIFAVRDRPVSGVKGPYTVQLRHGVSRVRDGQRWTLGLIFHDAR